MGVNGLVLAAETAIGKYLSQCVKFLKKRIGIFNNRKEHFHKNMNFFN